MAAALVRPGSALILDGGTTALAVAHALPRDLACTVITHSPTIAAALLDHPQAELLMLTTADAEEAAMKRALSARAADTYILASREKIGTASRFRVLPWEKVSGLITDADPGNTVVGQLRADGVEILTAG